MKIIRKPTDLIDFRAIRSGTIFEPMQGSGSGTLFLKIDNSPQNAVNLSTNLLSTFAQSDRVKTFADAELHLEKTK